MNIDELQGLILDKTVTDEMVFNSLMILSEDRYNTNGEIIPMPRDEIAKSEELGRLLLLHRKEVFERFEQHVLGQHYYCCGEGAQSSE